MQGTQGSGRAYSWPQPDQILIESVAGGETRCACAVTQKFFEDRFRHYRTALVSTAIHACALASVFV